MGGRKDLASKRQLSMIEESDNDSSDDIDYPQNDETLDNVKQNKKINANFCRIPADHDEQNTGIFPERTLSFDVPTDSKDSVVDCFLIKHFVNNKEGMPVLLEDSTLKDNKVLWDKQENLFRNKETDIFYRNGAIGQESLKFGDCENGNCNCDDSSKKDCDDNFKLEKQVRQTDSVFVPVTQGEQLRESNIVKSHDDPTTQDVFDHCGLENESDKYNKTDTNVPRQQDEANSTYSTTENIHEMCQVLIKTIEGDDMVPNTPKLYTELEADDLVKDTTLMFLTQDRIEGQPKGVNNIISTFKEKFSLPNAKHQPVHQKSRRSLELEKLATAKNNEDELKKTEEISTLVNKDDFVKRDDNDVMQIDVKIYGGHPITNRLDLNIDGTDAILKSSNCPINENNKSTLDIETQSSSRQITYFSHGFIDNQMTKSLSCGHDKRHKTLIDDNAAKCYETSEEQNVISQVCFSTSGDVNGQMIRETNQENVVNVSINQSDNLVYKQNDMELSLYTGYGKSEIVESRDMETSERLQSNLELRKSVVTSSPCETVESQNTKKESTTRRKTFEESPNIEGIENVEQKPFISIRERKQNFFSIQHNATESLRNKENLYNEVSPTSPVSFDDIVAEHILLKQGSFGDDGSPDVDNFDQSNKEETRGLWNDGDVNMICDGQLILPVVQIISDNDTTDTIMDQFEECNDNDENNAESKNSGLEISRETEVFSLALYEQSSNGAIVETASTCIKSKVRFVVDQPQIAVPSTTSQTISLSVTTSSSSSIASTSFLSVPNPVIKTTASHNHLKTNLSKPPMLRHVSQPNMGTGHKTNLACQNASNNSTNQNKEPKYATKDLNSDLAKLKATAIRLKLTTRRPSYVEWLEQYRERRRKSQHLGDILTDPPLPVARATDSDEGCYRFPRNTTPQSNGGNDRHDSESTNCCRDTLSSCSFSRGKAVRDNDKLTVERKQRIEKSLEWLKTELQLMRTQDQSLARQLLSLYHEIHKLRLSWSCQEHRELLDEVRYDLEELYEFSNVLDLPRTCLLDTPLKHVGVTRMNISARRFSAC